MIQFYKNVLFHKEAVMVVTQGVDFLLWDKHHSYVQNMYAMQGMVALVIAVV